MPKNAVGYVAIVLSLLALLLGGVSQFYDLKADVRAIQAELKYLHGDVRVPAETTR